MKTVKLTLLALTVAVGVLSSCKKKKEAPDAAPAETVKSSTFNTNSAAWTLTNKEYSATLTVEDIDESILSDGAVNVYMGDGTGSSWTAMPVIQQNIEYRYSIAIHTAKITVSSVDDQNTQLANPGVQQFKIVIIKGSERIAHPDVDWNNYNEVKRTFHLAD